MATRYTYSNDLYSDFFKEAYGFRPNGIISQQYNAMTPDQKQAEWDSLDIVAAERGRYERELEAAALLKFQNRLADVITIGADDEETALRWMVEGEVFYHLQCVEHWVFNLGILFTDYGMELVKKLEAIVEYVDPNWLDEVT